MDDIPNLLQRDYGLKPQGKGAPMSTHRSTQGGILCISSVYDDVFGGPLKFTAPLFASQSQEAYVDMFRSFSTPIKNSSVLVFDAPIYDEDIFGGLKGNTNSAVPHDDVFRGGSSGALPPSSITMLTSSVTFSWDSEVGGLIQILDYFIGSVSTKPGKFNKFLTEKKQKSI